MYAFSLILFSSKIKESWANAYLFITCQNNNHNSKPIFIISWPNTNPILHSLALNIAPNWGIDILQILRQNWQGILSECNDIKINIGVLLKIFPI